MINVSDHIEFNNEKLINVLENYLKTNPCCKRFPNCTHPEYQSNGNVFNLDNEDINIIKTSYFNFIKNLFFKEKLNCISSQSWVYFNQKNQKLNNNWHNHMAMKENEENKLYLAGLIYLTNTNFGTKFKTKFMRLTTIPYINRWYVWPSIIDHIPMNNNDHISTEYRMVIATSTIFEVS